MPVRSSPRRSRAASGAIIATHARVARPATPSAMRSGRSPAAAGKRRVASSQPAERQRERDEQRLGERRHEQLRHAGAALALDDECRSPPFGEHDGEEQDGRGRDPGHPDADEGEQQERLPLAGEIGIEERRQAGARLDREEGPGIERAECLPQPVQGGDEAARRSGGHPFGRNGNV